MSSDAVRFVVFEEEGWWVGQCLEYDLATQAKTLDDLLDRVEDLLIGQVVAAGETGRRPFANLPEAPERYQAMWGRAVFEMKPLRKDARIDAPDFTLRRAA